MKLMKLMNLKKISLVILFCLPFSLASKMIVKSFNVEIPAVLDFAISPNEKWVLTGMENNQAVLWNMESNRFKVFPNNSTSINALAFSNDGKYVAFQSDENMAKVFTLDGKFLFDLKGHKETIRSLEFSPKSDLILSGSEDNTVRLWSATNGKLLKTIKSHIDPVNSVGFSPNSDSFFSASEDGYLRIWNLDGKLIYEFKDHESPIMDAQFSPDGKKILTGGDDGKMVLNDLVKKTKKVFDAHSNSVRSVEFSKDGNKILSSSEDRFVKLWKISGELIFSNNAHEANINQAKFLKNNFILTGSDDGTLKLISEKGKILATILVTEHGKIVYSEKGNFDYDTEKLEELLFYHPDETELDIDSKVFYQVYFTPNLFKNILNGSEKDFGRLEKLFQSSPPPEVSVKKKILNGKKIEIEVSVCDSGGGIEEIFLYQNKILLEYEKSKAVRFTTNSKCAIKIYQTSLINGVNSFQAASTSSKGLMGYSNQLTENYSEELQAKQNLHLFIIGIDKFKNKELNLEFASTDGKKIRDKLTQKSKSIYENVFVNEIYNEEATKENVFKLFKKNKKISSNDSVIFFFSGHGTVKEKNYYFLMSDFDSNFSKTAISSEEITDLISEIDVFHKLVLFDTCESGGAWINQVDSTDFSLGLISKKTGVSVFASSMEKEFSYESKKIGSGLLAKSFLDALDEKGDVYTANLVPILSKKIPELANLILKKDQNPSIFFRGKSFKLAEN